MITGPLTVDAGKKTYVVGVVSWGVGCARPDTPGVYARVTSVMPWIREVTKLRFRRSRS